MPEEHGERGTVSGCTHSRIHCGHGHRNRVPNVVRLVWRPATRSHCSHHYETDKANVGAVRFVPCGCLDSARDESELQAYRSCCRRFNAALQSTLMRRPHDGIRIRARSSTRLYTRHDSRRAAV